MSLGTEKVRVPDAQQTAEHGNVLLQRRLLEVLVHGMATGEELMKVVVADVEADAETDGAPDAVATTHPVGESKHVLLVNAELGHLGLIGGQGDKVLGDVSVVLGAFEEPMLCGVGVGGRLGGGKGLGGDEKEGGLGVAVAEGLCDMRSVDVGDKVKLHVALAIGFEGLGDHDGATRT